MKKHKFAYLFLLSTLLCTFATLNTQAQCNATNDNVDWAYSWLKTGKNYMLDNYAQKLSDKQEMAAGDSVHLRMCRENDITDTHSKSDYLNQLAQKIAKNTQRPDIKYKVHVIKDKKVLNAFSVAGGHLYITEKMLDWVESEDELAFILAHEIAHIDQKHAIRKIQELQLGKEWGAYYLGSQYADYAANAQAFVTIPFGQIDEYSADKEGAILTVKAGYDVRKGLRFFEKMGEKEQYNVMEKVIRTHPYSQQRIVCLDDFLRNELKK